MKGKPGVASREITIPFIVKDIFKQIGIWFRKGDRPPPRQVKSIYLMVFLNIVGIAALIVWCLSFFGIKFENTFKSLIPLAFVAFITLCPGLYGLWVSVCCWRRVYGYDWNIIPEF